MCESPYHSKYFEDIEVFGYSSKLFRDDEKALVIDEGRHLISWMGDANLTMDRFDVRLLLNNLPTHEPSFEYEWRSLEEKEIEELCDRERYRALSLEETKVDELKEEEIKRQRSKTGQIYNQVSFSYVESNPPNETSSSNNEEKLEEPFTNSLCKIHVPSNVPLPKSKSQNQIIEKTAKFIASNGAQMEILIKTRQANNEKFRFLNTDDNLYPYYRLVLDAIRTGSFNDKVRKLEEEHEESLKFSPLINVQSAPNVGLDASSNFQETSESVSSYEKLVNNIHNLKQK